MIIAFKQITGSTKNTNNGSEQRNYTEVSEELLWNATVKGGSAVGFVCNVERKKVLAILRQFPDLRAVNVTCRDNSNGVFAASTSWCPRFVQ